MAYWSGGLTMTDYRNNDATQIAELSTAGLRNRRSQVQVGIRYRMLLPLLLFLATSAESGSLQVTQDDYQRAESFLPGNASRLIFHTVLEPHWIGGSDQFWYIKETRSGKDFLLVDSETGSQRPAFDHKRLAKALSRLFEKSIDHRNLSFDAIDFQDDNRSIRFVVDGQSWICDLHTYQLRPDSTVQASVYELPSPDGKSIAFVRDYNLYVRAVESGEETQLSHDGIRDYDYATPSASPITRVKLGADLAGRQPVAAIWSPDSGKLLTQRLDRRSSNRYHWVQSVPASGGPAQKMYTGTYPLPGEKNVPKADLLIFDVHSRSKVVLDGEPISLLYYGTVFDVGYIWWADSSERVYFNQFERGYKSATLYVADAKTGRADIIVREESPTWVDVAANNWEPGMRPIGGGAEVLWWSQRDGYGHLYLYNGKTGRLNNQVTSGEWVVREVLYIDEAARTVYFTAGGRESGRDPYLRNLYRVGLDGSDLRLLTPEDADHEIHFSPTGRYFIDVYSRVDTTPILVLRRSHDGSVVRELGRPDLSALKATGWQWPEPFKVKARDGTTDIFGVMVKPSNFDPDKQYPVLDFIYGGPQRLQTPKSFSGRQYWSNSKRLWDMQALAELGFIVITIDGLGMPYRSKAFHDVSYKNLADGGIEDHISGLRQLATRRRYIDLSRVGIFGISAGGYASTRAILAYPDFFKVAVSSAGNHDHRTDKAEWVERYMGFEVGDHYIQQANPTLAHKLKGKLLIAHGEMDPNVHPASTLQLVDALVKANKDFDLLIIPNQVHNLEADPYFTRKRWDYFVRHLLNVEPPREYLIAVGDE